MKTNPFTSVLTAFAALFLFVAGCNTTANESATKTTDVSGMAALKKQAIETEITSLTTNFFQAVKGLDIDQCMTYFENAPRFLAVNPDGTFGDYASLKKLNGDGFGQIATLTNTPKQESIWVLSNSLVLYTYTIGQGATLKNGQEMSYENVAGTMLLAKINGAWKATFYQESALPPAEVK